MTSLNFAFCILIFNLALYRQAAAVTRHKKRTATADSRPARKKLECYEQSLSLAEDIEYLVWRLAQEAPPSSFAIGHVQTLVCQPVFLPAGSSLPKV